MTNADRAASARHPTHLRRILAALLASIVAMVIIAVAAFLQQQREDALNDARVRAVDATALLAEHIKRMLQASDFIVGRVADLGRSLPMERLRNDQASWRELMALRQGMPEPGTLWVVGADGIVRLGTLLFPAAASDVTGRLYFLAHQEMRRDLVIGPLVNTKGRNKQAFHISRRIESPEGAFLGVAAAGFDADTFTDFYRTLPLGTHGSLSVIDLEGRIVLRQPEPERWANGSLAGNTLMDEIRQGGQMGLTTARSPMDEMEKLVAWQKVPQYGVVVLTELAVSDALQEWHGAAMATIAMVTAMLAVLAALGVVAFAALRREEALVRGLEDKVRQRTEEAEAQAEQARRANDSKTRFLATASHDLRQPLQAAGMFIEALSYRLAESPHAAIVEKLRQSVDATHTLLTTLLDVSTLEACKIQPNVVTFPLMPMLASLYDQMEPDASARSLRLSMVPTSARIVSDPVLLERMLRNLMVNALRYTEKGGVVVGCRRRGRRLAITVADSGMGIPDDKLEVIFDDFTRLGNKGAGPTRGLGLGLAVVRRTAALLGHGIEVQSALGRGSRFAIWVDMAPEPAPPSQLQDARLFPEEKQSFPSNAD